MKKGHHTWCPSGSGSQPTVRPSNSAAGGVGTIDHVINDTGAAAQGSSTIPVNVVGFP